MSNRPFDELLEAYRTKCEDWGNMGRDAVLDQLTALEDAILARVAALEADKLRMDWLADDPPFDEVLGMNLHEIASDLSHGDGPISDDTEKAVYRRAFRLIIDHAMAARKDQP